MNLSRTLQISVVTALCTAAAAQSALAGGEPKNIAPFTHSSTPSRSYTTAVITASAIARARAAGMGEPKNERPFSRQPNAGALERLLEHSQSTTIAGLAEPKNQAPFMLHVGRGA